jgi:hypothetical protein
VFKYEDGLENIIDQVVAATGLPATSKPLPRLTSSNAFDGNIIWDIKEIETVRNIYRQDFEQFGYAFDDVPSSQKVAP